MHSMRLCVFCCYLSQTITLILLFLAYSCNARTHETDGMNFRFYVLIVYMSNQTYSLKSTPKKNFWEKFHENFSFTLPVFSEICWEIIAEELSFHIPFCLRCLISGLNRGLISNKPTHYLLDDGDCKLSCV